MCGIAGLHALDGRTPADPAIVDAMCRLIVHRGPDDQGVHVHGGTQIGMRRLAIIDLAGGHQPIPNEDRTVWVVFNGEIYNFRALRQELESLGHVFHTHSDTECIVHAWESWGEGAFARLRGMFAIALLDQRAQRLVLARDRLGKKPLYWTVTPAGQLAFASELKSLFALPGFRPAVSAQATRDYFALGYVPAPGTIYEGVHKLPPGHCLVAEQGTPRVSRYWQLAFEPKWNAAAGADEAALKEELLQRLDDAVQVRLVSDVPFGAFLSGGIDSSVVAVLMARHLRQPLKTFTIGFRENGFDELPDARAVARHIGAEHHELVVEADAVALMRELVWYFDEPFGDASAIPTFLVSRLAAGHVKMVLSGDGGDELFGGYERYRRFARLDAFARGSLGLGAPALRLAAWLLGGARGRRLARIAERVAQPFPDRYLSGVALNTAGDLRQLLHPDLAPADPYASLRGLFAREDIAQPLDRIIAADIGSYLADDILVKVDRMTMANSIEARAPLLDHELAEFAARLPADLKLRGGTGKYLLKQVARELLPEQVLNKPKQGFAIPLARWLRGELRELMCDTLDEAGLGRRGVFDAAGVRRRIAEHLAGTHDHSEALWLVLTYELWARRFADAPPQAAALPAAA